MKPPPSSQQPQKRTPWRRARSSEAPLAWAEQRIDKPQRYRPRTPVARWRFLLASILVHICFLLWGLLCLPFALFLPEDHPLLHRIALLWNRHCVAAIHRYILKAAPSVEGIENLPKDRPFIVASAHQSMWETLFLVVFLHNPLFILKQSLLRIPSIGLFIRKTVGVGVGRGKITRNHIEQLRYIEHRAHNRRPIIIFPEGTRQAPFEHCAFKSGVFRLYESLGWPVVPAALNSGMFLPKRGRVYRGSVSLVFLPALAPGMTRRDFMTRLEKTIREKTDALCLKARNETTAPGKRCRTGDLEG